MRRESYPTSGSPREPSVKVHRIWSVAELASKAGVNRSTLTALELGKPGTAGGIA